MRLENIHVSKSFRLDLRQAFLIVVHKGYYNQLLNDHQNAGGVLPEDPGIDPPPLCAALKKRNMPADSPNIDHYAKSEPNRETSTAQLVVVGTQTRATCTAPATRELSKAIQQPKTGTERIWRMLEDVADPVLLEALKDADICALDDCSEEKRQLWESSGGMLRLLPSSKMYHSAQRPYSEEELLNPEKYWKPAKVHLYQNGISVKEETITKTFLHEVQYGFHTKNRQGYLAIVNLEEKSRKYGAPDLGDHEQSAEGLLASESHLTDLHQGKAFLSCYWPHVSDRA